MKSRFLPRISGSLVCLVSALTSVWSAEQIPVVWMTGKVFRQELERSLAATWTNEKLRPMLLQVSRLRGISVVLDRRIDPSAEYSVSLRQESLLQGLKQFAELADAGVSIPENFVYLGPMAAAKQLRTLMELRQRELQSGLPERRRWELQQRRTVAWNDLDSPREILTALANQSHVIISNIDAIPHDLWAGSTLPEVTLVQALSVILIQFDQTFRWNRLGAEIEVVPIPPQVLLEKTFRPRQKPIDAITMIRMNYPDVDAEVSKSEVVVKATVEELDEISILLQGKASKPAVKKDSAGDLRKQSFTLSIVRAVPTIDLMNTLEEKGIHFEYDAEELRVQGIDLQKTIQLDVKNLSAEEFFKVVFDPLQLEFKIDRINVKLKPKRHKGENK